MIPKGKGKLFIFVVIMSIFLTLNVMAQEQEELIDPDIPESWYESPKTASEMDINKYNQSPILDKKVEEGELPPVEERLPEDPPVIEPYNGIGEYGGTIDTWTPEFEGFTTWYWTTVGAGRPTPDSLNIIPFYFKNWEYSEENKKLTIYLRKDTKWSDGEPVTADDYLYWWEHVANNEDLNPVPPEKGTPPLLDVVKDNKWQFTFHFGETFPHYHNFNFVGGLAGIQPAHFMENFHPDFIGEEEAANMASEDGLDSWDEYYSKILDGAQTHPEYKENPPVISPYVPIERTETYLLLERNPYYPFVDTEGNQLPYIDKVRINLANNPEMARTKAATGDASFQAEFLSSKDIPLYKRNEEKESFSTLIYRRAYGAEVAVQPNLTHADLKFRTIFQDTRFRKALSLALDREDINNKVYYGEAVPMQSTVLPMSKWYKQEYADSYAEYDPEKAKELLDEMGMVDTNGDGYREMPQGTMETMNGEKVKMEGEKFTPEFLFSERMGPVDPTSILELAKQKWEEIGLNIELKQISDELLYERRPANKFDIGTWTLDGVLDPVLGRPWFIGKSFAPIGNSIVTPWPGWINWFQTNGEEGMEPPEKIKEIADYGNQLLYSPSEEKRNEAGEKLMEAQANNLWSIGTVGLAPQPIIIDENLKNIPEKGIWCSTMGYIYV